MKDFDGCWTVINEAREQMIKSGRHQWTEQYPAYKDILTDINNGNAYVLTVNDQIAVYGAVVLNGEPAYEFLEGKWLTTATDDDHTIPILIFGINTVEGSDDTLLYALALHSGSKKARLELQAIIVAGKLIAEIAITGSRGTRHYRNALAEHRESQFLLQIEDTFFFQRPDDFLSLASHISHRIVGVYVVDDP